MVDHFCIHHFDDVLLRKFIFSVKNFLSIARGQVFKS